MPIDNTTKLKRLMKKNGWSIEDLCKMLPVNGKPRSFHTVNAWLTPSRIRRIIPDDCLTVLELTVKLKKFE